MRDRVELDSPDLTRLAVDLTQSPVRLQIAAATALEVHARKVADGMKADATGHRSLPRLQDYVSYERKGIGLEYEVGFDKRGQGNLANIAAFGTSKNAPVMDHAASLRAEEPHIIAALLTAAEKAIL